MTHSPEHGRGIPPLVARTDREPAPSPQEIRDAFDEAKADIEAAKLEGVPPRISPSAQRVLDHAAADSVREQIHALLGTHSEAHGHEAGHGNGHEGHGHDGHGHEGHGHEGHGHDGHGHEGHGHAKTPPKSGNLGTRVLGDAAGVASAGAIGASGVFGWLWEKTFGRIKAYGDENAPDALKAVFGDKGDGGGKKKKGGGHGHGHDDHGGGHH